MESADPAVPQMGVASVAEESNVAIYAASTQLRRGEQDSSLPGHFMVLRGCKLPENYRAGELLTRSLFKFNPIDGETTVSVFVKGMTTPSQVCELIGSDRRYRAIASVLVDNVRTIYVDSYKLDVVWDEPTMEDGSPDYRQGADGHAGITGLTIFKGVENRKGIAKKLMSDLVDAVEKGLVVINDDNSEILVAISY